MRLAVVLDSEGLIHYADPEWGDGAGTAVAAQVAREGGDGYRVVLVEIKASDVAERGEQVRE